MTIKMIPQAHVKYGHWLNSAKARRPVLWLFMMAIAILAAVAILAQVLAKSQYVWPAESEPLELTLDEARSYAIDHSHDYANSSARTRSISDSVQKMAEARRLIRKHL